MEPDATGAPDAPTRAEHALAIGCVALLASAPAQVVRFFAPGVGWERIELGTDAFLLLVLGAAGACALRPRPPVHAWPVLLPVALAFASLAWTVDRVATLRGALGLAGASAAGLLLAGRFPLRAQVRAVAFGLAAAAAVGAAAALALPGLGVMGAPHAGAWQGAAGHKNALGHALAPGVLAFAFLAATPGRGRSGAALGGVALLLVLGLARSVGALLVTLAGVVGTTLLARARRRRRGRGFFAGALALVVAAGFAVHWAREPAAGLLGTDPSLNERTLIWTGSLEAARERPWLGWGFDAFWESGGATRVRLEDALGFFPWNAHNGYLDLFLDLGIAGVLAFGVPFALALAAGLRGAGRPAPLLSLWPLALLGTVALANLGESRLAEPFGLHWALYVTAAATLARPRRDSEVLAP